MANRIFPEIYRSLFGATEDDGFTKEEAAEFTRRDAAINTVVLRKVVELMHPHFDKENGFTTGHTWRVVIEDQHDAESAPHYVLDFGENCADPEKCKCRESIEVQYCDNYSQPNREISQAPGVIKVTVMATKLVALMYSLANIKRYVARAYYEALVQCLPDYYITVDKDDLNDSLT